jgi:hypothetical protein
MSVTSAAAVAAQILSNTLAISKTVREQAKQSKDTDLKAHISDLYDSVLSLKEAVMLVSDENNELRRRIAELEKPPESPEPRQVGDAIFYFVGEKGPYCQPCFDGKGKLTLLSPVKNWNGGLRRDCSLCGGDFYEKQMNVSAVQLGGPRRR